MSVLYLTVIHSLTTLAAPDAVAATSLVSRNDVVYRTPSGEPWDAMPVGGGDLSAMARCDGAELHLHLTKSDAWGYQAPPDAPLGTRFFNNVSPGDVRIALGEAGKTLAQAGFEQRLDLLRGRIVVRLGMPDRCARLTIWGHPNETVLFVEVEDPHGLLGSLHVELSEWRDSMTVTAADGQLVAREVHTRPAAPHMATSGMQDYFDESTDPLLGRGTAVVVGTLDAAPGSSAANGQTASFDTRGGVDAATIAIACSVTAEGDPVEAARREFDTIATRAIDASRSEQQDWWREYWSASYLALDSPDGMGEWLTASYYVHLYTLGCVNRGPVPAKWDGGPGLMRGDERTWGLAEWVQEIRFTFLPLYAANRIEMAKGLTNHYTRMRPYLREQTQRMWGLPGLWIPETVLPWGGVEDWSLRGDVECLPGLVPWDPASAPYGKFERYNRYIGFLFTCGPELCWHYLAYYRYTGDDEFLSGEAYPMVRDVAEFLSGLLLKGDDGRYHLESANALETWWRVRDPSDAMDGIRWLFGEFAALSEQLGRDADLRRRCAAQLAALPDPPIGVWHPDGTIDGDVDAYAPAAAMGDPPKHCNFENPALYRVFPFGLSGIGSEDYDRCVRTFEHRIFPFCQSWSMDAIWAARLGLKEQACGLLGDHTRKWNRYRYGGWDSGNSSVFPGNLAVAPYIDGAGVAFYGLHEILLQTHGGIIRILPAVANDWSGVYRLRAEGGFLVSVAFSNGKPDFVDLVSEQGAPCRIANPWEGDCVVRANGDVVLRTDETELRFDTEPGAVYRLCPADTPSTEASPVRFDTAPYPGPGLRGRDAG